MSSSKRSDNLRDPLRVRGREPRPKWGPVRSRGGLQGPTPRVETKVSKVSRPLEISSRGLRGIEAQHLPFDTQQQPKGSGEGKGAGTSPERAPRPPRGAPSGP